ncbi:hypothetical protein AB0L65_59935 [Nonomuraea sp. NPDC052116]|uniref:hypothetical protein n=1 Tax=Nonomuraea sp. NPDC052116 TaxID=3155665 RepID=UPI0034365DE3
MDTLESLVIARRLRVPIGAAPAGSGSGWGETAARQLDAALLSVFLRGADGGWLVKWLHLYLKGHPGFNQVEGNRVSASRRGRGSTPLARCTS